MAGVLLSAMTLRLGVLREEVSEQRRRSEHRRSSDQEAPPAERCHGSTKQSVQTEPITGCDE
jgi:hypothetical protein